MGAVPGIARDAAPGAERSCAFPWSFTWGVATAAYQIEGGVAEDGRRPSIWDTFSHTPGRVLNGETGDVACDHYHRWQEDVGLLRELGVGAYRFSIAWPRIVPTGRGSINIRGLDWYEQLVDSLLEAGIQPWVTLYHWDLPQPLEDAGGWAERSTAEAFARFVEVVARRLGDRIPTWITLNEPWCSAFLGYLTGEHAPGRRDPRSALAASHTLLLAHGRAVQVLRSIAPRASVGIAQNPTRVEAASDDAADLAAARRADGYFNRWLLDPIYGRGYPADMLEHWAAYFSPPSEADLRTIAAPIDFLGINYYRPIVVRADPTSTFSPGESQSQNDGRNFLGASAVQPPHEPVTQMDWTVRPSALTQLLLRLHRDYPVGGLAVTENGAAYLDPPVLDGQLDDPQRSAYLAEHIAAVADALDQGVPVTAYFVWSLLDNFEWSQGYANRFGLVHVDYSSLARTLKRSGRWYRELIAGRAGQHARE